MKPWRNATSSGQAMRKPCRRSRDPTNSLASRRLSGVPVSSQANPRPIISTPSWHRSRYARLTSVISSSPRAEGFRLEAIGAPFSLIEMREPDRGDRLQPKQLRGFDPAVAGNDLAVVADQHRVGETEPLNAAGDLLDLFQIGRASCRE